MCWTGAAFWENWLPAQQRCSPLCWDLAESDWCPWRVASLCAQAIPAAATHVHHARETAAQQIIAVTGAGLAAIQFRISRNISVSKDMRATAPPAAPTPCPRARPAAGAGLSASYVHAACVDQVMRIRKREIRQPSKSLMILQDKERRFQ